MGRQPGVFTREVHREMRHVAWPTRAQTLEHTLVVVLVLAAVATMIVVVDAASGYAISRFFGG